MNGDFMNIFQQTKVKKIQNNKNLISDDAHPAHAAIFLSMEAVFAAVGGWWLLGEILTSRALLGCSLMLSGMLISQLWGFIRTAR